LSAAQTLAAARSSKAEATAADSDADASSSSGGGSGGGSSNNDVHESDSGPTEEELQKAVALLQQVAAHVKWF
jgi:hypothetical protein